MGYLLFTGFGWYKNALKKLSNDMEHIVLNVLFNFPRFDLHLGKMR